MVSLTLVFYDGFILSICRIVRILTFATDIAILKLTSCFYFILNEFKS